MADNEYINSGYITKMGDNSTHNGNAGQPVDGVDFPHSGLIKALNAMATTGYAGLTASVGTGSKNFNMQMNDSSGQTVITVRTGKVIRGGVLMGATTEATITEIVHTGSMTDTTEQFQEVTADDPGANRYHLIVVDSTNAVKIRQSPGVDKVADLDDGDIPIAVLRMQRGEAKATRHIQYLTSSETTGTGITSADAIAAVEGESTLDLTGDVTIAAGKDLTVDTNTLHVDSANDRVGIGTATPEAPLHVESSGTGVVVRIESTNTGGGDLAPDIVLHRNTSVSSEELAHMKFTGLNTTPAEHLYADMYAGINTATAGNESGEFFIRTLHTGNLRRRLDITKNEVVINENSINSDFRVESDGNANMLFVDAGNNRVGIANASPSATLDVTGSIASDTSVTAPEVTGTASLTTQGLMFQVPEALDQTTTGQVTMSGLNSIVYVFDISNAPSGTPPGNSNIVELPDPITCNHAVFTIRNVGSNPIDITIQGGLPFDGGLTTHALVTTATQIDLPVGQHVTVQAVTDSVVPLVTGYYIIGN